MIDYVVPVTPVSLNSSYPDALIKTRDGRTVRRRFASAELVQFKEALRVWLTACDSKRGRPVLRDFAFYRLTCAFLFPANSTVSTQDKRVWKLKDNGFYLKNGKVRGIDSLNMLKSAEDGLAEYLGINDTMNLDVTSARRPASIREPVIVLRFSEATVRDPVHHGGQPFDQDWLKNTFGEALRQRVDLKAVCRVLAGHD